MIFEDDQPDEQTAPRLGDWAIEATDVGRMLDFLWGDDESAPEGEPRARIIGRPAVMGLSGIGENLNRIVAQSSKE